VWDGRARRDRVIADERVADERVAVDRSSAVIS
jgi:hypothetical protein